MRKNIIYKALRNGYHLSKEFFSGGTDDVDRKKERLLFTFGGRTEGWPSLGRMLYDNEPSFKASIESCNRIIRKNGGADILSYFRAPIGENYYVNEASFICITAIQIATVQLYKDNGIFPNAVIGLSLGEPTGVFAAGALTVEETVKIVLSYSEIHEKADKSYIFMFFKLSISEGIQLCKECPIWSEVVYEDSSRAVIIACNQVDIKQFEAYIEAKEIKFKPVTTIANFPYHTSLISLYYKGWESLYKYIEPKPLKCDYYSSALGKCIPKNTILDNIYWYDVIHKPVLFDTVLRVVLNDGYETVLQIGPPAVSDRQWSKLSLSNKFKTFNSFQLGSVSEISNLSFNIRELKKSVFEPTLLSHDSPAEILNDVLKSFDIHAIGLNNHLAYLKNNGEIHFLPRHNAWMVFGYDNTDYILKHPDIFTSSAYNQIDHVLMGADPTSHKIIRNILQPLFSSQAITEISKKNTRGCSNTFRAAFELGPI